MEVCQWKPSRSANFCRDGKLEGGEGRVCRDREAEIQPCREGRCFFRTCPLGHRFFARSSHHPLIIRRPRHIGRRERELSLGHARVRVRRVGTVPPGPQGRVWSGLDATGQRRKGDRHEKGDREERPNLSGIAVVCRCSVWRVKAFRIPPVLIWLYPEESKMNGLAPRSQEVAPSPLSSGKSGQDPFDPRLVLQVVVSARW